MRGINGDIKFFYVMNLVPPEVVGFQEPKIVKVLETFKANSLWFLSVRRCCTSG